MGKWVVKPVDCVRTEEWADEPVDVFWDWVESVGSVSSGYDTSGSRFAAANYIDSVFKDFVKGLAGEPTLHTTIEK